MALDPGKYHGVLKSGTTAVSQSKKTPQIALVFEVTHRLESGNWTPLQSSAERTMFLALSDGAWEYTQAKLKTLGFNGDFAEPKFDGAAYTDGVELLCQHEEYEGKVRERWDLAHWGDGPTIESAPSDVVRMLNAKWKAKNGNGKAASAPPPSSPPKAPAPSTAPAPAASSAATGIMQVTTRDEAWQEVLAGHKNDADEAAQAWGRAIEKVSKKSGKDEGDFGDEEWEAVAIEGSIPF